MNLKLLLFIGVLFITACSTKLDVVETDGKSIPVVYAFLDGNFDKQYVRVTKSFLGSTNEEVNALSKDPNFNYYKPEEFTEAVVERLELNTSNDSILKETYLLSPDFFPLKQEGFFNINLNADQQLEFKNNGFYSFTIPKRPVLDDSYRKSIYRIRLKTTTGITLTAATPLIRTQTVDTLSIDFTNNQNTLFASGTEFLNNNLGLPLFKNTSTTSEPIPFTFGCRPSINAFEYEVIYRFPVDEFNADSVVTKSYNLDLKLGRVFPSTFIQNNKITVDPSKFAGTEKLNGLKFKQAMVDALTQVGNKNLKKLRKGGFIMFAIGEELATYLKVTNGNFGFVIDKPAYSNIILNDNGVIKTGIGLFSCYTSGNAIKNSPPITNILKLYTIHPLSPITKSAFLNDNQLKALGLYQMD